MNRKLLLSLVGILVSIPVISQVRSESNSILVIKPYRHAGTWVFDDESVGLYKEPFVAGVPEILDQMVADIPEADKGFRLLFSAQDFPGATHQFLLRRPEKGGIWYYSPDYKTEGWLCPALFKYFRQAPNTLYVKAEPLTKHE